MEGRGLRRGEVSTGEGTQSEDGSWVCTLPLAGAAAEAARGGSQAAASWLAESL